MTYSQLKIKRNTTNHHETLRNTTNTKSRNTTNHLKIKVDAETETAFT